MDTSRFILSERLVAKPIVAEPCGWRGTKPRRIQAAFTLIELLVVIAIIAILIALLLPALQRAKYQAKLVTCSSSLRQVAIAATLYAADYDGLYPYRSNVQGPQHRKWALPNILRNRYYPTETNDVPVFLNMGLKDALCPFSNPADTWNPDPVTSTHAVSNYSYYFGWQGAEDPGCHLFGMNQQMTYNDSVFDILASDIYISLQTKLVSSHPDVTTGRLSQISWGWKSVAVDATGPLDMNFCRTDGSVFRLNDVTSDDSRVKRIPMKNDPGELGYINTNRYNLLPPAGVIQ